MLKTLTITGVDEYTPISKLAKLSHEFPFVEWGVLFSLNRKTDRYPSTEVIRELILSTEGYNIRFAAHLCGGALRKVVDNNLYHRSEDYDGVLSKFINSDNTHRHQLNFNNFDYKYSVADVLEHAARYGSKQIILQDNENNRAFLESLVKNPSFPNVAFLADSSGGVGKEINLLDAVDNIVCGVSYGFAGGLGPDNIDESLKFLYNNHDGPFWVDMESAVRTDDKLDMDKVRSVLEIANKYWEL